MQILNQTHASALLCCLSIVSIQAATINWDEGQQTTNDDINTVGTSYNTATTVAAQGTNAVAQVALNGEVGTTAKIEARSSGLLTMWRQANNPTADGYSVVSFANSTGETSLLSLEANIGERFTLTGRDSEYSWFVETSSGTFSTGLSVYNGTTDVTLASPTTASWFSFDGTSALSDSTIGAAATPDLTDIVSVGMFFRFGLDNDAHNTNIGPIINTFSAIVEPLPVVPEPSSVLLLSLAGLGLLSNRRR